MKNVKTIVGIVLLLVAIGTACFFAFGSRNIKKNPPGTIGNTPGNLQNGGLFCEDDGRVYFSNAYDGGTLYSMNPDESGIVKLNNAVSSNINVGGEFVIYYQSSSANAQSMSSIFRINGVYRSKKNGKGSYCLQKIVSPAMSLFDNTVVYQQYDTEGVGSITLHKTDIDKKNEGMLSDQLIDPGSVKNGTIYYAGTGTDRSLYSMNVQSASSQVVYKGDCYNAQLVGDYIYFMDIPSDYHLYRYSLSTGQAEEVTTERIDCYNVAGNYIYYQTATGMAPALKRMRIDKTGEEIVSPGVYSNINATSRYVYFNAYDKPTPVYHTPVEGPVQVNTFVAPEGS